MNSIGIGKELMWVVFDFRIKILSILPARQPVLRSFNEGGSFSGGGVNHGQYCQCVHLPRQVNM